MVAFARAPWYPAGKRSAVGEGRTSLGTGPHAEPVVILVVLFIARFALGYQFQSAGSLAPFLIQDLAIDYV